MSHSSCVCQSWDPSPGCLVQVHGSQSLGVAVPITPGARCPTLRRDTGQAGKGVLIPLQSPRPCAGGGREGRKAEPVSLREPVGTALRPLPDAFPGDMGVLCRETGETP